LRLGWSTNAGRRCLGAGAPCADTVHSGEVVRERGANGACRTASPNHCGDVNVALLVFALGDNRFALPCDRVTEIIPATAIQALPRAPEIVEGVVNLRGTIVPVLDIRRRFALPPSELHQDQHFIIASAGGTPVALRVDRALDVVTIAQSAIHVDGIADGAEHIAGIAVVDDGLLVIQDLDRFLALDEARDVDAALASAPSPSL
jgi:purine-binding chemotaxis protein CheW